MGLEIPLSREIREAVNSNAVLDAPPEAIRLVAGVASDGVAALFE